LLASSLTALRLTLHVLAASIWVGGQFTLLGMVPTLRGAGETTTAAITKAFSRLAWPAYVVLIATGLWNVATFNMNTVTTAWKIVLGVKITVALLAGLAAYLHQRAKSKSQIALWGSLSGLTAVAALTLGVFLAG
jgi:putative copper export protein